MSGDGYEISHASEEGFMVSRYVSFCVPPPIAYEHEVVQAVVAKRATPGPFEHMRTQSSNESLEITASTLSHSEVWFPYDMFLQTRHLFKQ